MPDWIEIAAVDDLLPGESMECVADGKIIALFRLSEPSSNDSGDQFYAIDGICPHHGGPLGKGTLKDCIVTCPWHGWQFNVTDGSYQSNLSLNQLRYQVKIVNGKVLVNSDPTMDNQ